LAWTRRDEALSTLGLSPGASQDEIRSRYRALCLEHHPDHGGDPDRFRAIAAAMESLRA
jgi:curved DNA-binding protein CbpA